VATSAFSDWKPRLQASVDDLKLEVNKLHKAWDRVAMDRSGSGPGILEHPLSASMRPPAGFSTDGPDGHHVETNHQDLEFGKVFTHSHIPVKGTSHNFPHSLSPLLVTLTLNCARSIMTVPILAASPSCPSLPLMVLTLSCGSLDVRAILICTLFLPICGFVWLVTTVLDQLNVGFSQLPSASLVLSGKSFVHCC